MSGDPAKLRFAVLHHQWGNSSSRDGQPHYDWMFQQGDGLRTWAAPIVSLQQPFHLQCQPLPDHRLAYLDYQGPISGDRGSVTRVIGGQFDLRCNADDRFVADIRWLSDGQWQTAEVELYRTSTRESRRRDDSVVVWWLRFSPGR